MRLPRGHVWAGGASVARDGVSFVANMPTEEVFTMPDRCGVDGVVYATRPLNFRGRLIEGMRIRFEQGRAVEATASEGQDALEGLLAADEGAVRLGEVALVQHDSPISAGGILFYNTLFDENAACHLAFGKAYPTCIEGGDAMDAEELIARGANDSIVHEDFMIGSADMDVTGILRDGTSVPVFRGGNFVDFGA
ncbi:MAG: aminopeptidase [Mailhella sp.]|nr:aminopeptidase [Mailhella sp.]